MMATIVHSEPLKLIVPGPAGSSTDTAARVVMEVLQKRKTDVVVFNKPGAGGVLAAIAAQDERRSFFVTSSGALVISPLTLKQLPYDPARFTPIYNIGFIPNVLTLRRNFPATNMEEFIKYAVLNPGKVTIGVATARTTPDIAARAIMAVLKLEVQIVPYTGKPAAAGLLDVLGGRVDAFYGAEADAAPFIQTGELKLVLSSLPTNGHTPSVQKYAPGVEGSGWLVLVANDTIPSSWHYRFNKQLDDQRSVFAARYPGAGGSLEEVQRILRQQKLMWATTVRLAKIEKE